MRSYGSGLQYYSHRVKSNVPFLTYNTGYPVGLAFLPIYPIFFTAGFFVAVQILRRFFVHTNITITPNEFRIKRTIHLKRDFRDSVSNPEEFKAQLNDWEKKLLSQSTGPTSNLSSAEV